MSITTLMRILLFLLALLATPALAETSDVVRGQTVSAQLITAENGVSGATLTAGLALELDEGWKTYWRSPGEVGLPPELDWSASTNVASATMAFPAPNRFVAFEIENYGYGGAVTFPLAIEFEDPNAPATLRVTANLLVCEDICIPEAVSVTLDLPSGGGIDGASAAQLAEWVARVPGETGFTLDTVHLDDAALTLTATADAPITSPSIFPEHGAYAAFGAPEIALSDDGMMLWAKLPVLSPGEGPLDITLVDGANAATLTATLSPTAPAPFGPGDDPALWRILFFALIGGLILNVMPCVLPVLSIKLAKALQAQDKALASVRASFLATAAGVLAFFGVLAAAVIAAQSAGMAVGWGVQFQQPVFLAIMVGLMVLFAANLFGLFEVALPSGAQTSMAKAGGAGLRGDFATGAFAAVMATPCSAPFLGTAVTYALTQGPARTMAVFLAMGAGLALPYLAVAARPVLVRHLPRPGAWMNTLRLVLGGLMVLAAVWILTVLMAAAGPVIAVAVAIVAAAMLLGLWVWRRPSVLAPAGLVAVIAAALVMPTSATEQAMDLGWEPFAPTEIAAAVENGETIFVDVTAAWCLTCKANKRLVLDRDPVQTALDGVRTMQADWTRPNEDIAAYLKMNDRFGIPFNIVYGPGAPEGIALPELLTDAAVLDALEAAR